MPYMLKTSVPLRGALMETPGDFGPLPMFVLGAAQLNRPGYPGLGAVVTPVSPYALSRRRVLAVSPYARGRPRRGLMGEPYTDRPWANLARASISGSFGNRLGYYEAVAPLVPRVGAVRSARAGLSGYYRIDLARRLR